LIGSLEEEALPKTNAGAQQSGMIPSPPKPTEGKRGLKQARKAQERSSKRVSSVAQERQADKIRD